MQLANGSYAQSYPSGATPGTFLPLQLPIASLKTSLLGTAILLAGVLLFYGSRRRRE